MTLTCRLLGIYRRSQATSHCASLHSCVHRHAQDIADTWFAIQVSRQTLSQMLPFASYESYHCWDRRWMTKRSEAEKSNQITDWVNIPLLYPDSMFMYVAQSSGKPFLLIIPFSFVALTMFSLPRRSFTFHLLMVTGDCVSEWGNGWSNLDDDPGSGEGERKWDHVGEGFDPSANNNNCHFSRLLVRMMLEEDRWEMREKEEEDCAKGCERIRDVGKEGRRDNGVVVAGNLLHFPHLSFLSCYVGSSSSLSPLHHSSLLTQSSLRKDLLVQVRKETNVRITENNCVFPHLLILWLLFCSFGLSFQL